MVLVILHRTLTYFGSIVKIIIMIIFLILVIDINDLDCVVNEEKSTGTFEILFSCFEPFWV